MRFPGHGMSWGEFFKALKLEWKKDRIGDTAGAVTFAGVMALFPFILFLVALASVIIDPSDVRGIVDSLAKVAPADVTKILADRLQALGSKESTGLLGVSALVAIWSASGGMKALMRALNICYGVEEQRPFWKVAGIAIGMTLFAAVFALLAALMAVAVPAIAEKMPGPLATVLTWARLPIAGVLMMFLWAVLYYVLPDVQQRFKFITPGSVVGVIVWVLASYGFSQYVSHFGKYEATYGALGGIIVMLLWMWISAQVLLLGAEINTIIEHKSPEGKKVGAKRLADSGVDDTKHEKAEKKGYDTDRPWDQPPVAARAKPRPEPRPTMFRKLRLAIFGVGAGVSYLASRKKASI